MGKNTEKNEFKLNRAVDSGFETFILNYAQSAAAVVFKERELYPTHPIDQSFFVNRIDQGIMLLATALMPCEDLCSETHTVSVETPANVWEHLKQDYAPKWFKRRWPVKTVEKSDKVTFTQKAIYPQLVKHFPHATKGARIIIHKQVGWKEDED